MSLPAEKTLSETVQHAVDEYLGTHKGGFSQSIIGMVQYVDKDGCLMNLMIEPNGQATTATLGLLEFLRIWADVYTRQQIITSLTADAESED